MTRRLYLIRHGSADGRRDQVLQTRLGPQADPPLDEMGREQVRLLTRRLLMMPPPAAVYCSPLRRARETIAPFAEATGTQVTIVDDLAEWYGGAWEMKAFEEIFVDHPEVVGLVRSQDPIWHLAPGGEEQVSFQRRVVGAVEAALDAHRAGDVWVVCHGGVINGYVGNVLAIQDQEMFLLPDNTSLNTIVVDGQERHLWFLNDTAHLAEPQLFEDGEGPRLYSPAHPRAEGANPVAVKFLSEEWAQALKTELNANTSFKEAAAGKTATIQQVIGDGEGETHYWITIADDAIDMGVGDAPNPDATITQSYDTAVALAKSELSPVTAFMTGKVKIGGNMGLLLGLQAVLSLLPSAMAQIDVEY